MLLPELMFDTFAHKTDDELIDMALESRDPLAIALADRLYGVLGVLEDDAAEFAALRDAQGCTAMVLPA